MVTRQGDSDDTNQSHEVPGRGSYQVHRQLGRDSRGAQPSAL